MSNKPILNNTRKVVGWNEKRSVLLLMLAGLLILAMLPGICGR